MNTEASVPQFPRYAIYYLPEANSALYRFGAGVIGYDAFTGEDLDHSEEIDRHFPDWADIAAEPRKYGFHATLKAPFALASGLTEADLVTAFDRFARAGREVPKIKPIVNLIGNFVAIVPDASPTALAHLADDCVIYFDTFRAPLSGADRARRFKSPLTPRQIACLDRWGYPYVFDDFRFHMTLTGPVPTAQRENVCVFLRAAFNRLALDRAAIDRLALLRQDSAGGRFQVLIHQGVSIAL